MRLEYWSSRKSQTDSLLTFGAHFVFLGWLWVLLHVTLFWRALTWVNTSLVTQRVTSFVFFVHSCKQENKVIRVEKLKTLSSPVDTAVAVVVLHLVVKHSVLLTLSDWMFLIFLCELWHSVEVLQFWLSFKFVTAVHSTYTDAWCCRTHCITRITSSITMNVHHGQGQDINLSHSYVTRWS